MTHTNEELLEFTKDLPRIQCAEVKEYGYYSDPKYFRLPIGYSQLDYEFFVKSLDFEYDRHYPEIDGFIWFNDGSWAERLEYDGAYRWIYKKLPTIPDYLH